MSLDVVAPMSLAHRLSGLDKVQAMPHRPGPRPSAQSANAAAAEAAAADAADDDADADVAPEFKPVVQVPGAKRVKAPRTGFGVVRAVLSGDTIVIEGQNVTGAQFPPEKTLALTGVTAPRFARGKKMTDEPFAFESRECLRKLVIGKEVYFDIISSHEPSGRDYAVVTYQNVNLALAMLRSGLVVLKNGKDGEPRSGTEELQAAQKEAVDAGLGIHRRKATPAHHVRAINWAPDVRSFFELHRNVPIPAIVDQVRDGSTLRVELLNGDEPLKHTIITLYLAGALSPRLPLTAAAGDDAAEANQQQQQQQPAEPFAAEAQYFTELRLLHRDVHVLLQGVDKQGKFFGTIQYPRGNITVKLLEQGLAKLVPWSAALTSQPATLAQAEARAKQRRLNVWTNFTGDADANDALTTRAADSHVQVIQVLSGDSVLVFDAGKERKLWLASVRAPRLGFRGEPDQAYAQESKEYLRQRLIGQRVRVVHEYTRAGTGAAADKAPRDFVSIFVGKVNVTESSVAAGLLEVLRHRVDEDRSQFYDSYLAAEEKAQEAHRGRFSKKPAPVSRVIDLADRPRPPRSAAAPAAAGADGEEAAAETPAPADPQAEERAARLRAISVRCKQFLSTYQRDKNVSAVVEYVFSGTRFKLSIPKDNVILSFALAGVRAPAPTEKSDKGVPFSELALLFVRSRLLQHNVRIETETLDKGDNFIGSMFAGRVNVAVELLKEGLVNLVEFSARKSPYCKDLENAQREAQSARKGIWKNYDEVLAAKAAEEARAAAEAAAAAGEVAGEVKASSDFVNVRVTEIESCNEFYVHLVGDANVALVESSMAEFGATVSDEPYAPVKGAANIVAGLFTDGNWYRVRVDGLTAGGDYRVFFMDYGNHDVLDATLLRPLPVNLQKIPPLAHRATLSGVRAPKGEDYIEPASFAFNDLVFGQDLLARVDDIDAQRIKHLTLMFPGNPISVNKQVLRDGWGRLVARPSGRLRAIVDELKEHELFGKVNHYNIWEYGDVSDDEDEQQQQQPQPAYGRK